MRNGIGDEKVIQKDKAHPSLRALEERGSFPDAPWGGRRFPPRA